MTILNKEKASIRRVIIPDAILIGISATSIFGIIINISTTLFFGLGENFTSLKQLVVFTILTIVSFVLGFGRTKTISISTKADRKNISAVDIITISIHSKNEVIDYNLSTKNISCVYGLPSRDITLNIKDKHRYKIVITGSKIDNSLNVATTLRDIGVQTKFIHEEIRKGKD